MSLRTGRPPKENPKDTRIQIRLDKETLSKLDVCAESRKTNRSEIIRKGIDLVYSETKKEK